MTAQLIKQDPIADCLRTQTTAAEEYDWQKRKDLN